MKTRYKIAIIILLIITIAVSTIIMIDYVYANTHDFESIMGVFCPYFPISDGFVEDQIFFAVYHTDPIKQLDMIHYRFQSLCHKQIGGGAIDLNPDLSPSYALDYSMRLDSVFVAVPIMLGVISLLLIVTHLILKKKKIPSRPYVSFIAAIIILFIGIPNLKTGVHVLNLLWQNELFQRGDVVQSVIPTIILGFVLTGIGISILFKSKLTRNLVIYLRKRK